MYITRDTGREIKPIPRARRRRLLPHLLWALDLVAIGVLIGLIVANRLVVHQMAVYGESRMIQTSVLLDLMDDFLPYLVGGMAAVSLLSMAGLVATVVARSGSPRARATALGLLAAVVILSGLWWGVGRRVSVTVPPPIQATPTPVTP